MKMFRGLMSRFIISLVSALIVPVALAAQGATVVRTTAVLLDEPFTLINPCNDEEVNGTLNARGHLVTVENPNGSAHVDLFLSFHGTGVDTSGDLYTFGLNAIGTGTATVNGVEVITAVAPVEFISRSGSDNYVAHGVAHIVTTPNGPVVEFEFISTECRG